MKKNDSLNLSQNSRLEMDLSNELQENRFLQLVSKQGRNIVYVVMAIIALLILTYWLSSRNKTHAENDYFNADRNFTQLQNHLNPDENALFQEYLQKLDEILLRHPELHAKYDGPLAQALIFKGDAKLAQEYASLALNRTKTEEAPYYFNYAETTLLIADGSYRNALEKALQMKQEILKVNPNQFFGENLFTLNLLRIAMLQQQIGTKEDELMAWQAVQEYLKNDSLNYIEVNPLAKEQRNRWSPAFVELMNRFGEGKVSLFEYIEARKKIINS